MSLDGQLAAEPPAGAAVIVVNFPMTQGAQFDWHTHDDHQLAWALKGVLIVLTDTSSYVLPPTRALWIPAGLRHETRSSGVATMRSLYLRPDRCPLTWSEPTAVAISPLVAELISYLGDDLVHGEPRARAEALLFDLLTPVWIATVDLTLPLDPRAREVADGVLASPGDGRSLASWGREVGASQRTLSRAFVAGTGLSFGRWRTRARLQVALPLLAAGSPVSAVAHRVGYQASSAFVEAFRKETGVTPGEYFRSAAVGRRPGA